MLENPLVLNIGMIGVYIQEIFTVTVLYIIYTKSTAEMKLFRLVLLKLTFSDLLFSICLFNLLKPDVQFPYPIAVVLGPIGYFGHEGAKIGLVLAICAVCQVFMSIDECCYLRLIILYDKINVHKYFFSLRGYVATAIVNFIVSSTAAICIYSSLSSRQDLISYLTIHNQTWTFPIEESIIVGTNIDTARMLFAAVFVCGGALIVTILNFICYGLIRRKLNASKQHLSEKTFKIQRDFSIMLICQLLYPLIALSAPTGIMLFCMVTSLPFASNPIFTYSTVILVLIYPTCSGSFTLYFVRSYREFIIKKLSFILPARMMPTVITVESTNSMGTANQNPATHQNHSAVLAVANINPV